MGKYARTFDFWHRLQLFQVGMDPRSCKNCIKSNATGKEKKKIFIGSSFVSFFLNVYEVESF